MLAMVLLAALCGGHNLDQEAATVATDGCTAREAALRTRVKQLEAQVAALQETMNAMGSGTSTVAGSSQQCSTASIASRTTTSHFSRDEPPPIPVLGIATIFHAEYLLRCIRSIDFPVQTLVLVRNGEDADVAAAVETLKRERPQLSVVSVPDNSGCAGGWNRILAADLQAPWWLVVNDDIAFPPGALRNLAARVWARHAEPTSAHFKFW